MSERYLLRTLRTYREVYFVESDSIVVIYTDVGVVQLTYFCIVLKSEIGLETRHFAAAKDKKKNSINEVVSAIVLNKCFMRGGFVKET